MESHNVANEFRHYVDQYIQSNGCYGKNASDERKPFISRLALEAFWSLDKIECILFGHPDRIRELPELIKEQYLVVFSILVFMARPENISMFIQETLSDSVLPLLSTPIVFSESQNEREVAEEFQKNQWKFHPLSLNFETGQKLNKRHLSPYQIIPIVDMKKIKPKAGEEEDEICIYRVTLHPDCSTERVVIFKIFHGHDDDIRRLYENEVDMYSQLSRESSFDHIIKYYGSFESLDVRTIMLEHANGGTLRSFFEANPPLHSQADRERFWDCLMGLLGGLWHIHDLTKSSGHPKGAWLLRGTHQDIRPQNILVCDASDGIGPNSRFKFVDMGTGDIRKMKNQGLDRDAKDQSGNGMYSAPEACRDNGSAQGIRGESDIWSLGGIASEAFVWSIWGEHGRSQYQKDRIEATRKTRLDGGHHEGAFHDGDCVLDIVETWHKKTISRAGEARRWYSQLSRMILEQMLVAEPRRRDTAYGLYHQRCWAPNWSRAPSLPRGQSDPVNRLRSQVGEAESSKISEPSYELKPQKTFPTTNKESTDVTQIDTAVPADNSFLSQSSTQGVTPAISISPHEEELQEGLETALLHTHLGATALESPPRSPVHGHPDDSRLGRSLFLGGAGDPDARRRTVSESGFEGFGLPSARTEGSHASVASDTTIVGEFEVHRPPSGNRIPRKAVGRRPEDLRTGSDHRSQHRYQLSDPTPPPNPYDLPGYQPTISAPPRTSVHSAYFLQPHKSRDTITIDQVWRTCLVGKKRSLPSLMRSKSSTELLFTAFPGLSPVVDRLRGNGGRDQIFLVDDSKSMLWHRPVVAKTCRTLCYILKKGYVDPNATFELYFTSARTPVTATTSSGIQHAIETSGFIDDRCDMASSLDLLATKVIRNPKPVSIYVLTNGHWNLESVERFCGVEHPIQRLVTHVTKGNRERNWVGVQFIRFFDQSTAADNLGLERLNALDDELKPTCKINNDIVDTVDFDGDIRKMLMGGISQDWDQSRKREDTGMLV